jgi:hypothetical protein
LPAVPPAPIPSYARPSVSTIFFGCGILFGSAYVGLLGATLNALFLVIPLMPIIQLTDETAAAAAAETLGETVLSIVQLNYGTHQSVITIGATLAVLTVLMTELARRLIQRRRDRAQGQGG